MVHNNTNVRDMDRNYWGYKGAKEFVMLTQQDEFSLDDIQTFFTQKIILNFLNELYLGYLTWYIDSLLTKLNLTLPEKSVPIHLQQVAHLQGHVR